jgi:hypothetical protein
MIAKQWKPYFTYFKLDVSGRIYLIIWDQEAQYTGVFGTGRKREYFSVCGQRDS